MPKEKKIEKTLMALYAECAVYDRNLGRLEKGYHILSIDLAQSWLNISDRLRVADANEVAKSVEDKWKY